jgi:tRNA U34 5-methylaminomethyl-2-thiouridine-forming methyltransferase MnmC
MRVQKRVKVTSDGSPTIELMGMNEHYHSTHGAVQESLHVFISMGLHYLIRKEVVDIRILEVGLGTGLNCLCTLDEVCQSNIVVYYHGLEAYPLEKEWLLAMNYERFFPHVLCESLQNAMLQNWHKEQKLHPRMTTYFQSEQLQQMTFADSQFNLVYYDAFGPRTQPEMWTTEMFAKLFHAMSSDSVLVTYCAKGSVKRSLKEVGFLIETLPGPPGKREMIRAVKVNDTFSPSLHSKI